MATASNASGGRLPDATASFADRQAAAGGSAAPAIESLLSAPSLARAPSRITERLLGAKSREGIFKAWAAVRVPTGEEPKICAIADRLAADIAGLDVAIAEQLDAILHHPRFQQLESSWRSLHWLVNRIEPGSRDGQGLKVRLLNASKRELARDFERAIDFDCSMLWREVYDQQFDMPGGEPFGLLLADFPINALPEDQALLRTLSEVAAAAFAPLVAAPGPDLLGLESFSDLSKPWDLEKPFLGPDYAKWRSLRADDVSRFVGLVLPRVLARLPYDGWVGPVAESQAEVSWRRRGFRYREEVEGPDGGHRLWTSAAWAFAAVVIAEYERSGWFADIRGGSRGAAGGGAVEGLPVEGFGASGSPDVFRGPLDARMTPDAEARLAELGFVPLVADGGLGRAVFHSNQSLHKPVRFQTPEVTANAKISSMLQYMLCASRFAHYVKQQGRDKMGESADPDSLKTTLTDWLQRYVTPDDSASPETRAQMPLRAFQVEVSPDPNAPGGYRLQMKLQPHFQLDEVVASVHFVAELRRC